MLGVSSLFLLLLSTLSEVGFSQNTLKLSRDDFPPGFVFGAGTSAFQVEGAVDEDGRAPSVWDTFTHEGLCESLQYTWHDDVSIETVHRRASFAMDSDGKWFRYAWILWETDWLLPLRPANVWWSVLCGPHHDEDVKLMSEMGLDAYRFSISWSRLLPLGRGAVNPKGVQYYNNLINELVHHGIQPHVTIYHEDLPQILEDEYGGWLSPKIVEDFTAYTDVCFREFGDRVAHWTTINEPNVAAIGAYDSGIMPPERCSYPFGVKCTVGNSSVEPYIVVHHFLLAHASAASLYREKYQAKQRGLIGINVWALWCIPFTNSTADVKATKRALDFYNGWVIDPLVFGDYPEIMKKNARSRIPSFTKSESERLKGSIDFLGVNHYITSYVEDDSNGAKNNLRDYNADMLAKFRTSKDGAPTSEVGPTDRLVVPSSMQSLLEYFKNEYGNLPIYIQENGFGGTSNESLNDTARVEYISAYLNATRGAIRNGSNTKGYIVWSFVDVFEFLNGYIQRFGLFHVDFQDKARARQPKFSAYWYADFLKKSKEMKIVMATQQGMVTQ